MNGSEGCSRVRHNGKRTISNVYKLHSSQAGWGWVFPQAAARREVSKFPSETVIAAFQYLKETYRDDEARLFIKACSDRTRRNGFKLMESRLNWILGRKSWL